MIENHLYNLMMQMLQESQSLWRIKEMYMADADCDHCRSFWQRMGEDKEKQIKELQELIKEHRREKVPIPL
jgi:hypothetical protein